MDPILTGAAANNSSEAAKGILQEVKRHFRCVTTYKKNVDKFEEKRVKDLEEKAKNKCFIGLCPSIKSRYQLSRRAEKGATALEGLIQKHQFTGSEATDDEPVKDFEAFESRQKVFNDIMEAVKDTSTSMIGLYGIGGAGKSTLLKEIVRQVKKSKLFDCVVSLAIKDIPAIMTIQDQIAELLGLEWKGSTVIARELRLEDGKLLVVLDDLREKLNLKGMGIPFGEEPKRFKILVASRDQDVLRQCEGMYDQNNTFSIGCLDDNDASDLFKKIVGGSINPELQAIGDEIAKRCGGLPLAISAVAQTLRNKNQPAWENALSQLQSPSSTGLKDVSPAVYAALKLCYNHIEGDEVKRFFLLCSLLSHDFLIEVLLRYAIGLGLLPSDYTVEEARDRMSRWVRNLKASGLLLDSYSDDRIDMHDIICDVAISIASEENNHVLALKQEDALKDWPSVETIKWHSWIDLSVSSYTVLPDVVECPQLSFLHISGQYRSTKVPHDFFKEMKMLQVLDLTDMNLSSFPSSIGLLSSLQTLCLHQSELGDITVVGELKALEILSLWNSVIEKLPEEIGHLLKLKVLDLRGCTKLKIIPPGLISRLTKLEELYMGIVLQNGKLRLMFSNEAMLVLMN